MAGIQAGRGALLLALAGLVHAVLAPSSVCAQTKRGDRNAAHGGAGVAARPPAVILGRGASGLPPAVRDMRAAILAAAETGDIAELLAVMELGELRPEVGAPIGADPIAHLRSLSADGTGKEVLAVIVRLLEGGWAAIPGGRDIENNRIYVWPHLAEIGLDALSQEDQAALAALVGAEEARAIAGQRRYRGWRLSIGADGVWHMLTRLP